MRHTTGLLLIPLALALIATVFAVIGLKTGSTTAWCTATGAYTLLALILLVALDYHLAATKHKHEDQAKADENIGFYQDTLPPRDSCCHAYIHTPLNANLLLQEIGTQINAHRYLHNLP